MVPNYMQGWALGRHYSEGTDMFRLELSDELPVLRCPTCIGIEKVLAIAGER